jgi:hypothetical protein
VYSPWTVVHDDSGTLFHAAGTWRNARGEEIPAPKPIAVGEAPSGSVVDSEGEMEHVGRTINPENPRRATDAGAASKRGGEAADGGP